VKKDASLAMEDNKPGVGSGYSGRVVCPERLRELMALLASHQDLDPTGVFVGKVIPDAYDLDCSCEAGPQPKTILGFRLPKILGQICGGECIDQS
jgi:hypothetical protein